MSLTPPVIDHLSALNISSPEEILQKYANVTSPTMRRDLCAVERQNDARVYRDAVIERFSDHIFKRYYRFWFYIRGIPKLAFPVLITGSQKLLQITYIKGCIYNGEQYSPTADCVLCNNDEIVFQRSSNFRYFSYGIVIFAVLLLMLILRRGIAEAHLCVKTLKYRIFVRTSWYYWNHILMIAGVALMCAGLSLVSSIFLSSTNAEDSTITCLKGPLFGNKVQLTLSDYSDNLLFWLSLYAVSVIAYWPFIDFLIDLYDTPYKIFIEPEDMLILNGELKTDEKLFSRLALVEQKVRLKTLLEEIHNVYKEVKKRVPFRVETIPDELLEVAILRLHNRGALKNFRQKI